MEKAACPFSHVCTEHSERQEEFIVRVLRDTLCHGTSLVVHRHYVVFLSVRQAALPLAMPPNRPVGSEH
jgi:hypothetical protein